MQHLLTSWEYKLRILFWSILCSYAVSINSGSFLLSFFFFSFWSLPFYFLCRKAFFSYTWMSNLLACPYLRFRKYRWKQHCVCVLETDACHLVGFLVELHQFIGRLQLPVSAVLFYFNFFFRLADFSGEKPVPSILWLKKENSHYSECRISVKFSVFWMASHAHPFLNLVILEFFHFHFSTK